MSKNGKLPTRIYVNSIKKDLVHKIVLLGGPRQVSGPVISKWHSWGDKALMACRIMRGTLQGSKKLGI